MKDALASWTSFFEGRRPEREEKRGVIDNEQPESMFQSRFKEVVAERTLALFETTTVSSSLKSRVTTEALEALVAGREEEDDDLLPLFEVDDAN